MENINIISREKLSEMFEEEEKSRGYYIEMLGQQEIDGLLHTIVEDKRTGKKYAARKTRTVHMGFNSNEEGKVEEFIAIVEREGACNASWGVTGRTMHLMLANQLRASLPQYDWEVSYEHYGCKATKR